MSVKYIIIFSLALLLTNLLTYNFVINKITTEQEQ